MKSTIDQLAIFGGAPAFSEQLHVGRPETCDRAVLFRRLEEMLDRRRFTNDGPLVQEFERAVEAELHVANCVAMSSGTTALETVIRALDLTGEVIVPAFTFVGTAHALSWLGLTPVFCDIDPRTHNLDPRRVEEAIGARTTGIIGVHLWGRPCDIDSLSDIARRHNLKLIFDAAHAFGCTYRGTPIGNFGAAEILSFHATKVVTTFEGGAVVTNDGELAERLRLMRNFGFADYDDVRCVGSNGKLSEAGAAMGLTSLETFPERVARNREWYWLYRKGLAGEPAIECAAFDESERGNFQYVVIEVEAEESGITREDMLRVLWAENVRARRYFFPGCHRLDAYRAEAGTHRFLGETDKLASRVLALPAGSGVTADEIGDICGIVRLCVAHGPAVTNRLLDVS